MLTEVLIPGLRDAPLSLLYGRSRAADPALSDAIHESTGRKPWMATRRPEGMRLAFIEDEPRDAVLRGLAQCGHHIDIITLESYAQIVERAEPIETLTVRFVTPTCAGHRHTDRRRPDRQQDRSHLLPDARRVFGSIFNRWDGPPLSPVDWDQVWVGGVALQTETARLGHLGSRPASSALFRGVIGHCVYEFPTLSEEGKRVMSALGMFARYVGVGSRTGYGMGYVEVSDGRMARRDAGAQPARIASAAG